MGGILHVNDVFHAMVNSDHKGLCIIVLKQTSQSFNGKHHNKNEFPFKRKLVLVI